MTFTEHQLEHIAQALQSAGYCVIPDALDAAFTQALLAHAKRLTGYQVAGVGRGAGSTVDASVRGDEIQWIEGQSPIEQEWLALAQTLQQSLNRRLFLGLFSFESHFAHYAPGAFYEKHFDAFKGRSNRVLSCVTYLNENWPLESGGELVLYNAQGDVLEQIRPEGGTMVLFLSEGFPHEVLAASRDRFSIAGWFRVNNTSATLLDPPR